MSQYPPYESDHEPEAGAASFSRRDLLKQGTAAIVGGGAAALGAGATAFGQAPAVVTQPRPATAGRKFRALVRYRSSFDVQELTLNPIQPRQVVIRVQAAQACYSRVSALDTTTPVANAAIFGHGAIGVVEEAGPMVKRVQAGDRVIVAANSQCGECYNCLRGRSTSCQAAVGRPNPPTATMADGTPVAGALGGFAELIVAWEEDIAPVFSNHSAAELCNLSCVSVCGLGMAMVHAPVQPGSAVVVFGAGPIGVSAVQGARLMGASNIVVVDPIRYRRELALKVGAHTAVDPNAEGDSAALLAKLRSLTSARTNRPFAGGRGAAADGPDFVIEAVGGERFVPKVERYAREPHGIDVLQNAYALCTPGGWLRTCGVGYPVGTNVSFPAGGWTNGNKHHAPGNLVDIKRDIPRFARLMETGQFDGKAVVGVTVPLDRWREALEAAAYRTAITGIVTFTN